MGLAGPGSLLRSMLRLLIARLDLSVGVLGDGRSHLLRQRRERRGATQNARNAIEAANEHGSRLGSSVLAAASPKVSSRRAAASLRMVDWNAG